MLKFEVIVDNFEEKCPTIFILTYERTWHLTKTIKSLEKAQGLKDFNILFLVQGKNEEILTICHDFKVNRKSIYTVNPPDEWESFKKINANMRTGLKISFEILKSPWVVILEEDIEIAPDALDFFRLCEEQFGEVENYRATNSFSRMIFKESGFGNQNYVRLNFGVGWGWALNDRNYKAISEIWTGFENEHWDGLLEPYFRTGFVVNPWLSRSLNRGLDGSGANTGIQDKLFYEIRKSFEQNLNLNGPSLRLIENRALFDWRDDCYTLSCQNKFKESVIYMLQRILFMIHTKHRKNNWSFLSKLLTISTVMFRLLIRRMVN